jgi:hypothetical protein
MKPVETPIVPVKMEQARQQWTAGGAPARIAFASQNPSRLRRWS